MHALVGLLCVLLPFQAYGDIYKDTTYPYKPGVLEIDEMVFNPTFMPVDTIPMHTTVYYPVSRTEQFPVHYFVGGFDGIVPASGYSTVLKAVASHGYIVAGSWALRGAEGANFTHQAHMENVKWLQRHLHDEIPAKPNWPLLTYNCHSAGCDTTYRMTKDSTVVANVMWEPVSTAVYEGVDFISPNMILGAKLATGRCSIAGMDHLTHYDHWTCPRVLMEAEEFGHCDLLDDAMLQVCGVTGFCAIGLKDHITDYKLFTQGITVAWLNTYVQKQPRYLEYVLDRELIPKTIKLSMYETDVQCTA